MRQKLSSVTSECPYCIIHAFHSCCFVFSKKVYRLCIYSVCLLFTCSSQYVYYIHCTGWSQLSQADFIGLFCPQVRQNHLPSCTTTFLFCNFESGMDSWINSSKINNLKPLSYVKYHFKVSSVVVWNLSFCHEIPCIFN